MTDTTEKYRALINALYDRTQLKKIKWMWDSGEQCVWSRLGGHIVSLKTSSNSDFEPLCTLSIESRENEYLEGFNDENLGPVKPSNASFATWYQMMESLYNIAKRQATGADEALDNILQALSPEWDDVEF